MDVNGVLVRAAGVAALLLCVGLGPSLAQSEQIIWDFDQYDLGAMPQTWQDGDTQKPGQPAIWQIVSAPHAPSSEQVLAMATPSSGGLFGLFGRAFNLAWTDDIAFRDGEIEVAFRAVSGRVDQGGGIMWRVQDKNNYYVARFNPLEDNFRIYFVHNGSRQELVGTHVTLSEDHWHSMKIVQRGNEFEGYLDGEKLLSGSSNLFRDAGGVGLWTKADAVTWFDDLSVRVAE